MRMFLSLLACSVQCCICPAVLRFRPPSTALPAHPFFITKSWIVGGVGDWDYMTMDPRPTNCLSPMAPRCRWSMSRAGRLPA